MNHCRTEQHKNKVPNNIFSTYSYVWNLNRPFGDCLIRRFNGPNLIQNKFLEILCRRQHWIFYKIYSSKCKVIKVSLSIDLFVQLCRFEKIIKMGECLLVITIFCQNIFCKHNLWFRSESPSKTITITKVWHL